MNSNKKSQKYQNKKSGQIREEMLVIQSVSPEKEGNERTPQPLDQSLIKKQKSNFQSEIIR